jgi:hypothetical protein
MQIWGLDDLEDIGIHKLGFKTYVAISRIELSLPPKHKFS